MADDARSINEQVARKLSPDMLPSEWPGGEPPDYAGSIQAAWEIVEWMTKNYCFTEVSYDQIRNLWQCSVDHEGPGKLDSFVTADTAPMAICEAFLNLEDK